MLDRPRTPGPGMCLLVGRPQSGRRNVGVDLGGGEALVAEELLDNAKVRPALEEMRSEGMAERMG